MVLMFSCSNAKDNFVDLTQRVEDLEKKEIAAITSDEWENLDLQAKELEINISEDQSALSEEDQAEFSKIKGRISALKLKKEMFEMQEKFKDMAKQAEGFIDGITN